MRLSCLLRTTRVSNEQASQGRRPTILPGVSGNPGGRPRELRDVTELARSHSPKAIKTLVEIMNNETAPPAARIAASNAILDRAYGKPAQTLDTTVRPGEFAVADRIIDRWRENLAKLNETKLIEASVG